MTGAYCFYAFHDVYAELLRVGTSAYAGNHVTRSHLATPSAVTLGVLVVTTLGVSSTTTLTPPFTQTNWTSGAPLAESFSVADVVWMKYCVGASAVLALPPAAVLQVDLQRVQYTEYTQ